MGAMKRCQAFRFAVRPTDTQERLFRQFAGVCRFVHNRALALEIDRHASGEVRLGYVGTANLLPLWKRDPETVWLSGVYSQILQQSLKDLDRAYRNFFEKRAGFPKFQRNDFLHKVSTMLCKSHAVIVVEDLNVTGMSASAAGTPHAPGKNVRQKAGLNRSLLDQGWGAFLRMLEYKADWSGGRVVRIPPQYTSQTCAVCGHVSPENRTTQALFRCVSCSHAENADLNAARNILRAGHARLACGTNTSPDVGASAQEPTEAA